MGVQFRETDWTTYDVHAKTLEEAASSIAQMAEAAACEWFPRYEYETAGGRISTITVTVAVHVTMPRWVEHAVATRPERAEWDRFCRALRAHEHGHINLVVDHLRRIDERMLGLAHDVARRVWEAARATLAEASAEFDRITDDGRTHGAVIDVTVDDFTEV